MVFILKLYQTLKCLIGKHNFHTIFGFSGKVYIRSNSKLRVILWKSLLIIAIKCFDLLKLNSPSLIGTEQILQCVQFFKHASKLLGGKRCNFRFTYLKFKTLEKQHACLPHYARPTSGWTMFTKF